MENILLLGILFVVYFGARWAFRAYVIGKPSLEELGTGATSSMNTRRTLTGITQEGEYLGQPLVTLHFDGQVFYGDPDLEPDSMLCARTLAEYPVPFSFETPLGAFHPIDMHDEVIRTLVNRYPIVNADDLGDDLIWEKEGQWFDLTLKDDWLMLSIRDEREDEDFGSVTFFVGDEFDLSFATSSMRSIDESFLAYSDELDVEQARNYVERIPAPLLERMHAFCKFMLGEVAVDRNSVLFDGSIWAADIELVDAFLGECIELSTHLRALGDPADSTFTAPLSPSTAPAPAPKPTPDDEPTPNSDVEGDSIW